MATTIWSGYIIMSTLSCHVYYDHTDQDAPYWVSIWVVNLHISPNCHYILSSISKSHGSPKKQKQILLHLRGGPKEHLVKN